jgi:ATP:ADP antiporter, AAA family
MNYIQHIILNFKINTPSMVRLFKKVAPIFMLFFLISFVYHILRCLKITLIVKASSSGAEAIPFLKFWFIMPSAILFTAFYVWLAKRPNRKVLIYSILGIFSAFFLIFMTVLYPNKEILYLNSLSNLLLNYLPKNLHSVVPILYHWPETLFYIIAEMWSIIVLSILFWGFCNEITKLEDAKRFYALIALGGNCAGICSGQFMQVVSNFITDSWSESMIIFLATVIISCIFIVIIFTKLDKPDLQNIKNIKTNKIAFTESLKYIVKYKYITLLAIMVLGYNIVFNLADVLWIGQVNQRFHSHNELNNYLAQLDSLVGFFSLIIGLFIFSNLINKFGWKITALVPPIIWLITSLCLYTVLFTESFADIKLNNLILILGTLQIAIGKAVKYCIFDQIKEITFIPLSIEHQRNSKAVIDGIISRIGKSGSSIILQGFLIFGVSEIITITPIIASIILITIFAWIHATNKMGGLIAEQKYLS